MAQLPLQLPSEVWHHVFGYLSAPDKFSVRTTCRYFKKLVDHSSLWKGWTVVLAFRNGPYNGRFWATLRHRKVTSVVVRSTNAKDWKQLAQSLPGLTTVVMDRSAKRILDNLKAFPALKRLAIRKSCTPLLFDASTVSQPQQLTHLSICGIASHVIVVDGGIATVSQFKNLESLVCHHVRICRDTALMFHYLLTCLPKLKHLSLSGAQRPCAYPSIPTPDPGALEQAHGLSSLELIDCVEDMLTEDAMRMVPSLKSLAVFYEHLHQKMLDSWPSPACPLKRWLSDLPELSSLVVVNGPPVRTYVATIPATLSSLTLCVSGLSSEELTAVSLQVPNLLHLHIDPWPSHLGHPTAQIPKLFPKLQTLKLRHEHVPEKDFLHLHQLKDLKYLEVLDSRPHLSALIGKLQVLTDYKLWVKTPPRQRDLWSCSCVSQVY